MKKIALFLAVTVLLSCALGGCGKKESASSAGIANPMVETDEAGLMEQLGLRFGTAADAEDVKYFVINNSLGEMQFTLDGVELCARIQPAAEFTDISGMNYDVDTQTDVAVGGCAGKLMTYAVTDTNVQALLWFDVVPGIMYSLSAQGKDLSAIDLPAIAAQVYSPMQGNAG